jgi:hypothetical protein
VFPNPRGPITDHTKPYLILWNQPRLFDLLEGLTKLFLILHLVPAQEMDYVLVIDQIKPKALGISPLGVPVQSMQKVPISYTCKIKALER